MQISNKQLAKILVELVETHPQEAPEAADVFVQWMSEEKLLHNYRDVLKAIDQVWIEKYGIATITVESAHELSQDTKTALEKIAKGAEIKAQTDQSLIGGAKVRIDDRIIDGTVKGSLNQLTKTLTQTL